MSLARAIYSRASTILLDDIFSASQLLKLILSHLQVNVSPPFIVDTHTANHILHSCLKGELMRNRTAILVSHHTSLCGPASDFIVKLDNGRISLQGSGDNFLGFDSRCQSSLTLASYISQDNTPGVPISSEMPADDSASEVSACLSTTAPTMAEADGDTMAGAGSMESEKRSTGSIHWHIWTSYVGAFGGLCFWACLSVALAASAASPVIENAWLRFCTYFITRQVTDPDLSRHWSGQSPSTEKHRSHESPVSYYIGVYAAICLLGLVVSTLRWFILFAGSLDASRLLYERMLEKILFAKIRFHDTVSTGRLLNRFGKDFEGESTSDVALVNLTVFCRTVIDSQISSDMGHTIRLTLSAIATVVLIGFIAGLPFQMGVILLGASYVSGE